MSESCPNCGAPVVRRKSTNGFMYKAPTCSSCKHRQGVRCTAWAYVLPVCRPDKMGCLLHEPASKPEASG